MSTETLQTTYFGPIQTWRRMTFQKYFAKTVLPSNRKLASTGKSSIKDVSRPVVMATSSDSWAQIADGRFELSPRKWPPKMQPPSSRGQAILQQLVNANCRLPPSLDGTKSDRRPAEVAEAEPNGKIELAARRVIQFPSIGTFGPAAVRTILQTHHFAGNCFSRRGIKALNEKKSTDRYSQLVIVAYATIAYCSVALLWQK
ncbi:unnamed protein product [Protopolystoma xenopodis]|uniref:Uncharacterized protein n=1 Tax=Protopolystoma xenopodis TaxID=117903 RepID=A0A448WTI1_9PLAT|nr:unnamed protein product [Protopolystoma xenopodis]